MRTTTNVLFLASLLGVVSWSKPLNPRKVVWAIDCGATTGSRSSAGFAYQPDQGFLGGKLIDYSDNADAGAATIKYTGDNAVYMTERHADGSFAYEIPIPGPGKYVLITKFAEMWHHEKNKRKFNLKFGDTRVVENIDIVARVGKYAAYDEYVEFDFSNDQIFHNNKICHNAWDIKKGKLKLEFEKTQFDNPKVDGIVLFQGELADTDYYELPKMREEWEKRAESELRKREDERIAKEEAKLKQRERVKIRNDHFEESEEEFEDFDESDRVDGSIWKSLANSPGLILIGVTAAVLLVLSKFGGSSSFSNASNKSNAAAGIELSALKEKKSEKSKEASGDKNKKKK